MNPLIGTIINFLVGVGGLAESTGLTNVLTTSGGKAGAMAATAIAFANMFAHAYSSAQPGPMMSAPSTAKTTGLAIALLLLLMPGMAKAADLKTPQAIMPLPVTSDPFNGFYLGINGGYGFDRGASTAGSPLGSNDFNTSPQGFVGGFQAGYLWHFAPSFVFGVEGDWDLASLDGTSNVPGFFANVNDKSKWLASIRGRLGYLIMDRVLLYGTAGYGWGSSEFSGSGLLTNGGTGTVDLTATRGGAVFGGGLELAVAPNWLVRGEYLHYSLNDFNTANQFSQFLNVQDNVSVLRGALSYKF